MRRSTRLMRLAGAGVVLVAIVGVLMLFVFPTRTYLAQRHQLAVASARLRILQSQNEQLSSQAAGLLTDAEIEKRARQEYHFVRPGEQAFVILPPAPPVTPPPASSTHHSHHSLLGRSWHAITFWL